MIRNRYSKAVQMRDIRGWRSHPLRHYITRSYRTWIAASWKEVHKHMSPNEAAQKLKEALSKAPIVKVKGGKVEVETPDEQKEESSKIQKHKFQVIL